MKTITIDECTKMIRAALKQGFPNTKFSVRKTRSTYSHNIDVSWTDGPTEKQVDSIIDRFESKGFDGMTDCEYSCGNRVLCGAQVRVCGNYVSGSRTISKRLREIIVSKLAAEANITASLDQYGNVNTENLYTTVPFAWYASYLENDKKYMALDEFENTKHVLAHDSHKGEWFSNLVYRVENCISLEEQQPIAPELLPEYIDIEADASTGRASFEEPQKMFEGHVALDEHRQAVESFEAAPVIAPEPKKGVFNCSVGRSYPKPENNFTIR